MSHARKARSEVLGSKVQNPRTLVRLARPCPSLTQNSEPRTSSPLPHVSAFLSASNLEPRTQNFFAILNLKIIRPSC